MAKRVEARAKVHNHAMTDAQVIEGTAMREKGEYWQAVADHLGVNVSTLRYNLDLDFAEQRRDYRRDHYLFHGKDVARSLAEYYERNAEKIKQNSRDYRKDHPNIRDKTGKRFGKLVVVDMSEKRAPGGQVRWNCICDCGKTITVVSHKLTKGQVRSCGCDKPHSDRYAIQLRRVIRYTKIERIQAAIRRRRWSVQQEAT